MEKANSEATTLSKFKTYRDGLMLGLLASRPLRLRNLAGLTLDRTLVRRADGWWIQIPAAETKTKQPIEVPWPDMPVPQLQTYLTEHRPAIVALCGTATAGDALWLSSYGPPMTDNGISIVASLRARAKDWVSPSIRTYFEIALRPASRLTTLSTSVSLAVCLVIAPHRRQSGITIKHKMLRRAALCKTRFWRVAMASSAIDPMDTIR